MEFSKILSDPVVSTAFATWALVLFTAILCLGIALSLMQVNLMRRQIRAEHDLSRRTRSIDDIQVFCRSLDREHPCARRLVDDFTDKQIAWLVDRVPFHLPHDSLKILEYALAGLGPECKFEKSENGLLLNEQHLAHLLQLCCGHLNQLEVALLGWFSGIADTAIIEMQFKYIVSDKKGHYILEQFRKHDLLKDNYPAIAGFVAHLRKAENQVEPRAVVG